MWVKHSALHPASENELGAQEMILANSTVSLCKRHWKSRQEALRTDYRGLSFGACWTQGIGLKLRIIASHYAGPQCHACNPSYSGGRDQEDGGSKQIV
jgi:hypothetical protein